MTNIENTTIALVPQSIYMTLFNAYASWSTVPLIALPLGIFLFSFIKSQSYYQDNETFHTNLQDILDKEVFRKVIFPLYNYINLQLTGEIINKGLLPATITNVQEFTKEIDGKKSDLLKEYDFSSLEEAIELQDSIEKIIKSNRDPIVLKSYIKKSRTFLIATTILSFINLLVGFILQGVQAILDFKNPITITLLVLWLVILFCTFVVMARFYYLKTRIEKMRYE